MISAGLIKVFMKSSQRLKLRSLTYKKRYLHARQNPNLSKLASLIGLGCVNLQRQCNAESRP